MIFHCENCRYDFQSEQQPERCPDCGKIGVREATPEEKEAYLRLKEIVDREIW